MSREKKNNGKDNMSPAATRRLKRRRRQRRQALLFLLLLLILIGSGAFLLLSSGVIGDGSFDLSSSTEQVKQFFQDFGQKIESVMPGGLKLKEPAEQETETETEAATEPPTEIQTEDPRIKERENLEEQAEKLAVTYDYEGAVSILKSASFYADDAELQAKAAEYQAQRDACVEITPEDVTHIFYHSLVVDPSRAFNPDEAGYDGWQQWMTTVYEFDEITESMYERGYVLVSIHDLISKSTDSEGNVTIEPKSIYLPEGKKAFVLSLDDLSYYHTYDDHGVANRIVLDEEGKPTCEYIEADGTVVYGDYDVVPRMDTFLEEHPDGCYKGARGIIALTGYNGVLGYRTDGTYSEEHNENTDVYYIDDLQQKWLDAHPDYDWDTECAEAKKVADAMKAEGWEFASHTWGHKNIADTPYEDLVRDTKRWLKYVGSIVGETDAIIFAHGADITSSGTYTNDDDKYIYLKEQGFDVFCNVDSQRYTTTVTSDYIHQGRRNLDGYRIYNDAIDESGEAITSDLFDASKVLDPDRPLPVPDL